MKSNRRRILNGGRKALTACSAGLLALCLGLGSSDLYAQSTARASVRVCIGSQAFNLNATTSKKVLARVTAAAKKNRLTMPVPVSGKGGNTALNCQPKTKKAKASTRVLKVGGLKVDSFSGLLESLLAALLNQSGNGGVQSGQNDMVSIINAVDATEAAGTRLAALNRTNFVFVRDTVRAVENRFVGEDPNGKTLFNLRIPNAATRPWVRILSDMESAVALDARFVQSPGGGVQLNEFVFRRGTDGTMLVIHAPENNTYVTPDRDQLEILLSYGDAFNPNQVIRLPLSQLQDPSYNFLAGNGGPIGALRIGRDSSGQQYYGRTIVGLNGASLGVLEFPDMGRVGSGSKVIFKPAVSNNWSFEGGFPTLASTGIVITRRGVGYMEAASITMQNPYHQNLYGPFYPGNGIVDNLTSILRTDKISDNVSANSTAINQQLRWPLLRTDSVTGSILVQLMITEARYY